MSNVHNCFRCGHDKPSTDFTQGIEDRYYNMCAACVSEILAQRGDSKPKLHHTKTERTCYLCLRFLSVDQFTRRKVGTYFSACKPCNKHVFSKRSQARRKAKQEAKS